MHATGNVKVLGFSGYQVPESTPPGMTAKWGYNSTNEQIITKTTQPGSFDLVIITSALLGQLRLLNRIAPIDVSLLPNWTKLDPFFRNTPFIRARREDLGCSAALGVQLHPVQRRQASGADHVSRPPVTKLAPQNRAARRPLRGDHHVCVFRRTQQGREHAHTQSVQDRHEHAAGLPQAGTDDSPVWRGEPAVRAPRHLRRPAELLKFFPADAQSRHQRAVHAPWGLVYIDCYWVLAAATNVAGAYRYINQAIGLHAQLASTKSSLANPVVNGAITSLPGAMQYKNTDALLAKLPVQPGVTVKTNGPYVPFQMWEQWWEQYKSA